MEISAISPSSKIVEHADASQSHEESKADLLVEKNKISSIPDLKISSPEPLYSFVTTFYELNLLESENRQEEIRIFRLRNE